MKRSVVVVALCVAFVAAGVAIAHGESCNPCKSKAAASKLTAEPGPGPGKVRLNVDISGLTASTEYVLCLNGKVDQDGNDLLAKTKGHGMTGREAYLDFETVSTDKNGRLVHQGDVQLPTGDYDVTFLLKDKANNYCSVYCRDRFRFAVK